MSAVGLEACASAIANIAYADDARAACVDSGCIEELVRLLQSTQKSAKEARDHTTASAQRPCLNITSWGQSAGRSACFGQPDAIGRWGAHLRLGQHRGCLSS